MSKRNKKYESFAAKVGVGFDSTLDLIASIEDNVSYDDLVKVPPFNIKKTTDKDFSIDIALPGVKKENIKAVLNENYLTVTAETKQVYDPEGDDVYLHKGIFEGGKFEAKFAIARNLQFNNAELSNGLLSIAFKDQNVKRTETVLPIGPFPKSDVEYKVEYNSAGEPLLLPKEDSVETSSNVVPILVEEPVFEKTEPEVIEHPETKEEVVSVKVNETDSETPTTEVLVPKELPQIVEVKLNDVVTDVTTNTNEPQATIELTDATKEIKSDNATLEVIKTDDTKADIVVAIPDEVKVKAEEAGIDVIKDVTTAVEESVKSDLTTLPDPVNVEETKPETITVTETGGPAVDVVVPEQLPPVVVAVETPESTPTNPIISLETKSETEIPDDHVLVPVVTAEGQNDIVVAVPEELHDTLTGTGVKPEEVLSEAVKEADVEVVKPVETETVVVNADVKTEPTVEVELPKELPQVVEVVASEELPKTVDVKSEEPQISLEVKDATKEIVSDNVVTEVIKTEEGKADIVVAVDKDLHEELTNLGVDPIETVKTAIEEQPKIELPVVNTEDVKTVDIETKNDVVVTVPNELPPVMEVKVEDEKVVLSPVTESIPEKSELIPVVTAEGQNDTVIAVTPETKEDLKDIGVTDVKETVTDAVVKSDDVTVVTVNEDNKKEPTVDVVVPVEIPQIVEVKLNDVEPKIDVKSEEPQATVTLVDATKELSDNTNLSVVKTEEGKADIVVSVPDEVKAELDKRKVDIVDIIEKAINDVVVKDEATLPSILEPTKETIEKEVVPAEQVSDTISVEMPKELSPVMTTEIIKDDLGTTVSLVPADGKIPDNTTLVPVVTAEGQNDIVVAVPDDVKKIIEQQGEVVTDIIETAVKKEEVPVLKVDTENPETLVENSAV